MKEKHPIPKGLTSKDTVCPGCALRHEVAVLSAVVAVDERFDMDGENPEPPEPEEDYADVPDDRVDPHWQPASGARMTDEEWTAMLARPEHQRAR
jgi:hypothetical protein